MIKAFLKPDGFTVAEVESQIRLEFYTWNRSQNRRIRTARTVGERLYWWNQHVARRLYRAAQVMRGMGVAECKWCHRTFTPEIDQQFCSDSCWLSYTDVPLEN